LKLLLGIPSLAESLGCAVLLKQVFIQYLHSHDGGELGIEAGVSLDNILAYSTVCRNIYIFYIILFE
jgi:hypothetical protein